jgi:hypothetical protein
MTHFMPLEVSDLDAVLSEISRQAGEARELAGGLSLGALNWQPSEGKWSVGGHLAHMVILNTPYLGALERAIGEARAGSRFSDGPYRHGWFGPWFARSMEPPPKRRWKTAPAMVPDPSVQGDIVDSFAACQEELARIVELGRGVDLGRTRISSPFMKLMRFSVGAAYGVLLAHNRRHLWLIREVMQSDGFPG